MAKWNLDTIEADIAEIMDSVDKLEEINRLQAKTIERQAEEITAWRNETDAFDRHLQDTEARERSLIDEVSRLTEQMRQAQQALRNARDSALEEAAQLCERGGVPLSNIRAIRSLKSTTQGGRE
jgi:DNA repair ATPase RecN